MKGFFITATGTDVGKTVVTAALTCALRQQGFSVGVAKPAASGAVRQDDGSLRSEDASLLMAAAGLDESWRDTVNPYCLEAALAPATAAELENVTIEPSLLLERIGQIADAHDLVLVEGAGGLTTPLCEEYLICDLAKALQLPLLIVAQATLGSVNTALLTAAYAKSQGLHTAALLLNRWPAQPSVLEESTVAYMKRLTGLPVWSFLPDIPSLNMTDASLGELPRLAPAAFDMDALLAYLE
ncbi:dethiobiotin synthase [Anaeromusa sp.]|uniref:dethiobiotin synthase n=1 Tax=Anaeromusa sp. TaxID=1872520 RepID=UPI002630D8C3|nr:dethiobiotin synthase [Anaeromusa sp.]MDD3156955.1 dethiobiotin synthase [Anaeromusa sp.]